MKRLAIIASGDLGMQIAHLATVEAAYEVVGFFDDTLSKGKVKSGYNILGTSDEVESEYRDGAFDCLMIGIGYKHLSRRKELFDRFKGKIPFANIIHSTCHIDPSASLGEGILMYPGCIIDQNVFLSDNVLLNIGVIISHDTFIGAHSFLSPGVRIAGFNKVGESTNLGIGTIVIDNLTICDNVHTGGGTLIVKNIDKPGLYIGSPAKLHRA